LYWQAQHILQNLFSRAVTTQGLATIIPTIPDFKLRYAEKEQSKIGRARQGILPVTTIHFSVGIAKLLPLSEPTDADLSADSDLGISKGLRFFRDKKSNVVNFDYEADGIWRIAFRGSEILFWKEKNGKKAVNRTSGRLTRTTAK
jgi:hypothetical protein